MWSLPVEALSRDFPCALLQALASPSMFSAPPFPFVGGLPAVDWVPNCHSNPITQRVRRKRQRLPPSLLIENASDVFLALQRTACPRRFRSRLATIWKFGETGQRKPVRTYTRLVDAMQRLESSYTAPRVMMPPSSVSQLVDVLNVEDDAGKEALILRVHWGRPMRRSRSWNRESPCRKSNSGAVFV